MRCFHPQRILRFFGFEIPRARTKRMTNLMLDSVCRKDAPHLKRLRNMKINSAIRRARSGFIAVVLTAGMAATNAFGAAPALNGQLVLRSLTPQDLKDYSLTDIQKATGLT